MSNSRAAQLVEAGMWLRLSGDHEGARRLFEQALRLDPENVRARQLLESAPNVAAVNPEPPSVQSLPPPSVPDYPFAPPPTSNIVDLDWGSATGFAPTPVPFIPPVELAPSPWVPPRAAPLPLPVEAQPPDPVEPDLPIELEIQSTPFEEHSVELGEEPPLPTLVFGLGSESSHPPDPAPTVPERWSSEAPSGPAMSFDASPGQEVPWSMPPAEAQIPSGGTMQFAKPEAYPAPPTLGSAETMGFARPLETSSGSTMQFARPARAEVNPFDKPPEFSTASSTPFALPIAPAGGTMEFARPVEVPASFQGGTMQFARPDTVTEPEIEIAEDSWGDVMPAAEPAVVPPPAAPPMQWGFEPPAPAAPSSPEPDVPQADWGFDPPSSPKQLSPPPSEPKFAPNATSAWDQRSNPGIKISDIAAHMGSALDLARVDRPAPLPAVVSKVDEVKTLVRGAKDLLGLDDHSGAMDLILKAQELAPNDPEVQALRERSEKTLEAMFESKLGNLDRTPRVKLKDDEIIWLNLDHRAGFVLAQIDGYVTFEDLFSVSGMSRLDTARILAQLLEEGVIHA